MRLIRKIVKGDEGIKQEVGRVINFLFDHLDSAISVRFHFLVVYLVAIVRAKDMLLLSQGLATTDQLPSSSSRCGDLHLRVNMPSRHDDHV